MLYLRTAIFLLVVTILSSSEAKVSNIPKVAPQVKAFDISHNENQQEKNVKIQLLNGTTQERNSSLECLQTMKNDELLEVFFKDFEFEGRNSSIAQALQQNDTRSAAANFKEHWGKYNMTVLHWAAINGKSSSVRCLLKEGLDVNILDGYGNTPLHYAAFSGNLDTVKLLVESKACLRCKDKDGFMPMYFAAILGPPSILYHKDVVDYLGEKMRVESQPA